MASETDRMMDRRRLKRSVFFWRFLAIVAIVAVAAVSAAVLTDDTALTRRGEQIARIEVSGAITSDRPLIRMIERIGEEDGVKGVLLAINSPGGSTVGGESLYEALRELGEKKPLVAHIDTIGTSAAYMAALSSDHIVSWRTSITGSIGVLVQYGQVDDLLSNLGIEVDKVATGPLKAEPNPFAPVGEDAVEMLRGVVADSFEWFVGLVAERRPLTPAEVRPLADGRIMTGHQALEARLVDALGGEDAAIDWLETERGVAEDLPVRTWRPRRPDEGGFLFALADRIAVRAVEALSGPAGEAAFLDGLISVWHGPVPGTKGMGEARFE